MQKTIWVSHLLSDYSPFFDHSWGSSLLTLVKNTKLEDLVFDLTSTWKGASNARSMPYFMMNLLKTGIEAAANDRIPMGVQLADALSTRIEKIIFDIGVKLTSPQVSSLKEKLIELHATLAASNASNPVKMDIDKEWNEFLKNPEIGISLWRCESNTFGAIYFAYEDFLIRCGKTGTGAQMLKTQKLKDVLVELVGEEIAKDSWDAKPIERARLIRHALTHNGGRITGDLGKYRSELQLENDEIVILPKDTNTLFNELKERVTKFSSVTVKDPRFHRAAKDMSQERTEGKHA